MMAEKLLIDVINGQTDISEITEWLGRKGKQTFYNSLSRTEFTLAVLKYIQDETNKFILGSSSSTIPQKIKDDSKEVMQERADDKRTPDNDLKNETQIQRTPFQIVNKVTPTRTATQQFSRILTYSNDNRRETQYSPYGQESKNILTSTPVHQRRDNSRNEQFPLSPTNSFHSDQSSISHTPRSSKSSKINSSNGSHRFSPQSPVSPSFSPTSSHYSDSFPDLGSRNRSRAPQSPCLGDFIITKPSSQKSRKRIKPTQLTILEKDALNDCKKGNKTFGSVTRPFVPMVSTAQTEIKEQSNFEEERILLKQKRIQYSKIPEDTSSTSLSISDIVTDKCKIETQKDSSKLIMNSSCLNISLEKSVVSLPSSPIKLVDPNPSLISSADVIKRLATVYSTCLDANLIPNVTAELYLIFTLLTYSYKSKANESINSTKESQLSGITKNSSSSSGHCNSLLESLCLKDESQLKEKSNFVDEGIVKQENSTTQDESKPAFSNVHDCVMFSVIVLEKQIHTVRCLDKGVIRLLLENPRVSLFAPHLIPQLSHIAETKEIKEKNSTLSKKSFSAENGPVLYHIETDNRDNFSSQFNFNMFKKQRDGFYEILHEWKSKNCDNTWTSKRFPAKVENLLSLSSDPVNMMHFARLFCAQLTSSKNEELAELELPGVSKDKLSRLQARFSRPSDGSGSPRPPPCFPSYQLFYQQFLQFSVGSPFLNHVADCLVYRLNLLDNTDFFMDGLSAEESKILIVSCVTNCCLLAKFLGLIVFLPYKSNIPLQPDTLQAQIMVRDQMSPPVNVMPHLQRALASNRLIVTIPWITAFLGMMDPVAPYLASYRQTLQLLMSVYQALPLPHISSLSNLVLRCSLGWLFDTSFFPQHVFFSLISSCGELGGRNKVPTDVDVSDVVDETLLLEFCPYLSHLRQLLFLSATNKQGAVRHITPVPAQLTPTAQTTTKQDLELQLEESFLNGQATSFRSTVETVIDRVSSSCIKFICSNVIAPSKEEISKYIAKQKEELMDKQKFQAWIIDQCQAITVKIEEVIIDHCGPKIKTVLAILLGPDANDPPVFSTTYSICSRRCRERIINWLNSHINLTDTFSKLAPISDPKPSIDMMKPLRDKKSIEHRETAMAPADLIIELQDKICECIENRGSVMNEEQLLFLINKSLETVKHRDDLIGVAEQVMFTLTVDISVVLLAYSPAVVTKTVLSQLCYLWKECQTGGQQLERIMSARNTLLLCQGGSEVARLAWQQLSHLLVELLTHGLLTPHQLETQCVALFRLDWPPMVLTLMGACLSSMLDQIKKNPIFKQKPKFVLMLEWVTEMTEDLSREDNFDDV